MQLNVPPDLADAYQQEFLSSGGYQALKMCCAALLKPRTPRKAGQTRSAVRWRLISKKAIYRPSVESLSMAHRPAVKFRR